MKEVGNVRKSIKQSTLTLILNVTSIVLIAFSIVAFFLIVKSNRDVDKAYRDRYDLINNAKLFMEGSAYLTNEVRAYAATGNSIYRDNYWDEIERQKRRDIGVANMRKVGITPGEDKLVEQMFSFSNNLLLLEEESMLYSSEGRTLRALAVVYGPTYERGVARIRSSEANFIEMLNERTERHLLAKHAATNTYTTAMLVCLAVTAIMQVLSMSAVQRKVIRPILTVRDEMLEIERGNLHSDFDIEPDTSEIGMLISSIQSTKNELNKYIGDISEKLASIAGGDLDTRVQIDYVGDFAEIKRAINEIAQILSDQRVRDVQSREELLVAYEAAKAANRAKSNFLSSMSHEIRTPMNAIIGMTNIAQSTAEVERKDYCLNKINDASTHLLGVINDILDMSKIDANKFELSPTEFDFEKMLIRVVNVINFRVDEKHQSLSVHIDKNVPGMLVADEQRLAQVITNLLSNAVKFTPEGGDILLDAKLEGENDDWCDLLVSVRDTGIGISEEQQKKLFSSFSQADAGISRKYGGTGLGLAISKSIVEKMDGRIWIDSEEGKGAAFSFVVRVLRGQDTPENAPALSGVKWDELNILAVDDEHDIRDYFQNVAASLGFSCDVASDGLDACEKIEVNGPYDIYFVDWKMPGMNGIELVRHIRRRDDAHAVVVMISSVEWSTIEDEAKDAGVDHFVPKPLFQSVIADTISQALGAEMRLANIRDRQDMPDFSGRRILLVEDMEINREIVIALLEPTGVEIECAENGIEALNAVKEHGASIDMIFMDLHMPEMDGMEATKRIRAIDDKHAKAVPIIAMTANVFREDIDRCLEIGMNGHIGKPLHLDEVIEAMKKHLPPRVEA